jgi:putative transposase
MLNTRKMRFSIDIILVSIRWYAAYSLSCRYLEEMIQERDVPVDHSSINRGAIRFLPLSETVFRKHEHAVGKAGGWMRPTSKAKVTGNISAYGMLYFTESVKISATALPMNLVSGCLQ